MKKLASLGFVGGSHLCVVSAIAALAKTAALKTEIWCYGKLPIEPPFNGIEEPGLAEMVEQYGDRLHWTGDITDLAHCDIVYYALDVPTDEAGNSDLERIQSGIQQLLPVLSRKTILVIHSQIPPGFTRQLNFPTERLFYQVETLIFGQALQRAMAPERFIVGVAEKTQALPTLYRLYLELFSCPIAVMPYESAELAKIAINLYLASTVTVTNMLAQTCTKVGADWQDIAPVLRLDPRIGAFAYLTPGLGVTSANILRDIMTTRALSGALGIAAPLVEAMLADSHYRMQWVVRKLHCLGVFKDNNPATLAIIGLTYKPNTPVVKGSAADKLCQWLPDGTQVRVFEPQRVDCPSAPQVEYTRCAEATEAATGAAVTLVLTPDPAFARLEWKWMAKQMNRNVVLDPFCLLDPARFPMLKLLQLGVRRTETVCP